MSLRSIPDSGSRNKYIGLTFLVAAAIVTTLVAINRQYLFHAQTYEFGDMAANSLEVLQAKKFQLYYGVYSRWGFHHPGPVLLYLFAWGENLFWRDLHLTPTPLDAQVLVVILITSGFLAAGIGVAARWVRSPMFIPLAILAATLHFGALALDVSMLETWGPYIMPIPFFCLIIAAASVSAGQGEDLPLLTFTGCFFVHDHVAHPLFVFPLYGIAYAGLWRACSQTATQEVTQTTRPWQQYRRAHQWSTFIVALFLVPILVDAAHGTNSNIAAIIHHIRTHRGEHHTYLEAVTYFLKFAAYKPPVIVTEASGAEITRYIGHHLEMFGIWTVAILSPLLALVMRRAFSISSVGAVAPLDASGARVDGRWRFIGWLSLCTAVVTGLTIYWAHIQDGLMLHYNAWFNHGLYFTYGFLGVVALTDILESVFARLSRPRLSSAVVALLCLALTVATYRAMPERFKAHLSDNSDMRATASTVTAALADHPDAPRIKFIDVPSSVALGAGPAIALLLKRAGYDYRVSPEWKMIFGADHAIGDDFPASLITAERQTPMEMWRIVGGELNPATAAKRPLMDKLALEIGDPKLDAATNPVIAFVGPQYNADKYCFAGFQAPDLHAEYTLALDRMSLIQFTPVPIPVDASVEIRLDFFPLLITANHPMQRLIVNFNGAEVATFTARLNEPAPEMRVRIPGQLWNNAQPLDFLTLSYPDSVAPKDIDATNKDPRQIAFGARKITFSVVAPTP